VPLKPAVWTQEIHIDAQILSFHIQGYEAFFWAMVNTDLPKVYRQFYVEHSGTSLMGLNTNSKFVGTALLYDETRVASLTLHLFDNGVVSVY
jgi:hypothetical protein